MKTAKSSRPGKPQQVRIIGGLWKRTPLPVLDAEGLRPTPDRVRETLFNWINHLFDGQWQQRDCLDLFAGSGALGFEAASRGAHGVLMVEQNGPACQALLASKDKLQAGQITVLRSDAMLQLTRLQKMQQSFDLIFLDPPYQSGLLPLVLQQIPALLKTGGLVYLEAPRELDLGELLQNWQVVRSDTAGMVQFCLLQAV